MGGRHSSAGEWVPEAQLRAQRWSGFAVGWIWSVGRTDGSWKALSTFTTFRPFSEVNGSLQSCKQRMTRLIHLLTRAKSGDLTWNKHLVVPGIMLAPHLISRNSRLPLGKVGWWVQEVESLVQDPTAGFQQGAPISVIGPAPKRMPCPSCHLKA